MDRRSFLGISIPVTGAILLAPGVMDAGIQKELYQQFSKEGNVETYDVVINGGGLSGYFAALHAADLGKSVLLVEKRTSPGYDITAKRKLWLGADGLENLPADLEQLLFPEGERVEVNNAKVTGLNKSYLDGELSLFNGSIRKGMLRNLLVKKVHVLLMTDACGLCTDRKAVKGVMLASKHGIHLVKCFNFIDASDQVMFSRDVLAAPYQLDQAGFVFEVSGANNPEKKTLKVAEKYGVLNNQVEIRQSKQAEGQALISFKFPVKSQNTEEVEHQARLVTAALCKDFAALDSSLAKAKLDQFALETSIYLKDNSLPKSDIKGHYLIENVTDHLSCRSLIELSEKAKKLVRGLKWEKSKRQAKEVLIAGGKISFDHITLKDAVDPGLYIPLKICSFDFKDKISHSRNCQVIVAGGGTAGAMAGMGAVEKGASTIVVDYFNDLGGTKTMGGVMGYYHGYRDHKFFKKQVELAEQITHDHNFGEEAGRKLFHLQKVTDRGNQFLSGSIICGSLVKGSKVEGIVVCRNGRLEKILGSITIDGTGDGDIAYFAGANYKHGDSRTGISQNYSQWDYKGGATKVPSPTGRDFDFIDNTFISELQRGLFLSHYQAHFYDFHPMLTVRESRRIEGLYTLDLIDVSEGTKFKDLMTQTSSDFDPHNVGSSEYSKCGFLLPHSNDVIMEVPYRAIVPKGLDGLLISGKGISQTHNALQFTRMSADLAVLGFLTGQVAADQAWKNIQPKDYDISLMQKEWASLGYLNQDFATRQLGNKLKDSKEIERRVKQLAAGAPEYLYECAKVKKEDIVPVLKNYFGSTGKDRGGLLLAKALAWFGEEEGAELIVAELAQLFAEETRTGYKAGFRDTYDNIRDRKKNMLVGLYWRINQNIGLLAMSGSEAGDAIVEKILNDTRSGGGMVKRESDYYDNRIDLRLIPYFNRIVNLCFYADRKPDQGFVIGLENLLLDKNISGYITEEFDKTRWRAYSSLLEISIAASLARCGSVKGYELLVSYLDDIHYNLKNFAYTELISLTSKDLGYDARAWSRHIKSLNYPRPEVKLWKEVEL